MLKQIASLKADASDNTAELEIRIFECINLYDPAGVYASEFRVGCSATAGHAKFTEVMPAVVFAAAMLEARLEGRNFTFISDIGELTV